MFEKKKQEFNLCNCKIATHSEKKNIENKKFTPMLYLSVRFSFINLNLIEFQ